MTQPTLHRIPCPDQHGAHRLGYWQWGDEFSPHVVMCLHGVSRQGRDFDVLARAMVERADGHIRVICPDVAGRGASDWLQEPADYQIPNYVADMLVVLHTLHAQAPIQTLDCIGTSMGGVMGLVLCGKADLPLPVTVRRLVLNDVGPVLQWQALQRIGSYLGDSPLFESLEQAADFMWERSASFGPHTREQWLTLSSHMVKPLEDGGFKLHYDPAIAESFTRVAQASAAKDQETLWRLYDAITAQTLLLRGKESDLLTQAAALAMTERGPRAQLVEFDGVGHAPTLIADNQVSTVLNFIFS